MLPDYQPEEDQYAAIWVRVFTGPHRDHGGWQCGQGDPVCACGAVLAEPAEAAA